MGDGTVTNCYYLTDTATGSAEAKTADEFASGAVAWLLQNGQESQVWGQALSGTKDAYPVLSGDNTKKVCKVSYEDGAGELTDYVNAGGTVNLKKSQNGCGWLIDNVRYDYNAEVTITKDTTVTKVELSITVNSDNVDAAATEKVIKATSADGGGAEKIVAGGTLVYTVWVKVQGTSERPTIEIRNSSNGIVYANAVIEKADINNSGTYAGYYCVQIEKDALPDGGSATFSVGDGTNNTSKTVTLNN